MNHTVKIIWTTVSIIIFVLIITPLAVPQDKLINVIPQCEYKAKYNEECFMCGMTHSFYEITKGNFNEASSHNKGSMWLFMGMFVNQLVFIGYTVINKFANRKE